MTEQKETFSSGFIFSLQYIYQVCLIPFIFLSENTNWAFKMTWPNEGLLPSSAASQGPCTAVQTRLTAGQGGFYGAQQSLSLHT